MYIESHLWTCVYICAYTCIYICELMYVRVYIHSSHVYIDIEV